MKKLLLLIPAMAMALLGYAQSLSNKGKEFWVGYGHHQFMENLSNTQEMAIYLSAEQPAIVKVSIDSSLGNWSKTYSIPANTVIKCDSMPKSGLNDCRLYDVPVSFGGIGGEGIFRRKGIHIESNVPIVAYAHIYGSTSSGASMLMPVNTWGYSYTSINSFQLYASNCFSWFYVVAQKDSTMVEITPTAISTLGRPANLPFTVMLMKGQIYQYTGAIQSGSTGFNVAGSKIRSIANANGDCYPIAVFSGSSRTSNPIGCGSGGGDNDNQQLFPQQAWGKRYLTAPTSSSSTPSSFMTNSYRIVVKDPTTKVFRNGTQIPLASLQLGSFYYYESSTADYIEADKPIMMAQFMTGGSSCLGPGGLGDPEMIILSPIEQGIKKIAFYRNTRESIQVNYLTLIVPTAGISSLLIDGSSTFNHTYPHPRLTGYTVVVRRWTAAQAQATAQCDSAFTAVTYGLGSVESYGYNAGTLINNLNASSVVYNVNDPTATSHLYTCTNTPVEISMLVAYKPTSIVWKLSQVPVISPNADVTQGSPVAADSVLQNGIKYYKYKLPGTYIFSDTGTFAIPVLNTHSSIENCNNREEIPLEIIVKRKPKADFSILHSGCILDTVQFNSPTSSGNGYTVNKWTWTFPDATTSTLQNPSKLFTSSGPQNINLKVITTEGCVGDTTRPITIYDKPTNDFTFPQAPLCEGGLSTFTSTSFYGGPAPITTWYWDFGNATTLNAANGNPQSLTYPGYGTYIVKHVVKVSNTCISDTIIKPVTISAKPRISLSYPAGCLPAGGVVQFVNNTLVPDGQAINTHTWGFGDPNANAGNPNTSNAASPSHTYSAFGTYPITYSAVSANGCQKDTSFNATFNLRPTFSYPGLPPVCGSIAGTVSVATATVTNGVPGTGIYKGPGTDAAGNFNPAAVGPGIHTIWYVYSTTGGCTDSIFQTIQVRARPLASFSFPAGCLPVNGLLAFTNNSTISDAQTLSYAWDFNDPNANAGNPNTSNLPNPTHIFTNTGTYSIKLTVTTNNGCVKDTTVTTTLSVKPALAYPALASVCESNAPLSVATATVTNGVTGTGTYRGPGTNAAGNFDPLAAGPGTHTIWYVFNSTGNCRDSISQTIQVRARPLASFSFPAGCLPVNGLLAFTNNSTISDAQTLSYAWDFNDPNANAGNPNTSNLPNPTHIFTNTGTYSIKLTATTNNGCVKDTTVTTTLSVKPALQYPALSSICQSLPGTLPVNTATVTNGVTGTGTYRGPGTDAAGNFSPSLAGAGLHTIWYVFTSTGGCKDSVSRTIRVHPKPAAGFSLASGSICLNQRASITDNSTISGGSITNWNWNFGDGNTAFNTNGNPFTQGYLTAGNYTIRLIAISDSSCVDTFTQNIAVRPLPVTDFSLPAFVCMPNGGTTLNNLTTVADNSALSYVWDFGDASAPSGAVSPTHIYAASGSYSIRLRATSAFGCSKDTVKVMSAFFDKPIAQFQVNPDTLCQGRDNVFTDQSSAPNSTVRTWSWIFDDGTGSTVQNPVKRYVNPGFYDVRLLVTNNVGCVSDTFRKTVVVYLQPVIEAGQSFVVPQGTTLTFNATANNTSQLRFTWSPPTGLNDPTALRPTLVANADQTYTLTAVGLGNCSATDFITVKILKPVKIPNAFSPNGDGTNDTWIIGNLGDYPGAVVEVFNRYGQQVFRSNGYATPWNGTFNGRPLPVATYYYVIQLKNGYEPLTGSITIVR